MSFLTPHNTACVFCKCALVVMIDPACPGGRLQKLIPIAACNRCGDFRHRMRLIEDAIKRVCEQLHIARMVQSRDLKKIEEECREGLIKLTQSLMARLSQFYRVMNDWTVDFPQLLFDKPQDWKAALTMNENELRGAKKLPTLPRAIPEEVREEKYNSPYPDP